VDIWKLELDGGRPAQESPAPLVSSTRIDHVPQYSPDGKRIAFASNRSGGFEIWVANRDGTNAVQLTSFESSNNVTDPIWAPDGDNIYFISPSQDGKPAFYVIGSEEGKAKICDHHPVTWSRDGRWMYFMSGDSGDEIWKMPIWGNWDSGY